MDRDLLRSNMRRLRKEMPGELVRENSSDVYGNFLKIPGILEHRTYYCYLSYANEVDTGLILNNLAAMKKKLFVPVIMEEAMLPAEWTADMPMKKNAFGIPEPVSPVFFQGTPEVCIIPGVAFSKKGGRLGQGGGYYDKWLAQNKTVKVGLCYSWQLFDDLPFLTAQDILMDYVVTEKGIFVK